MSKFTISHSVTVCLFQFLQNDCKVSEHVRLKLVKANECLHVLISLRRSNTLYRVVFHCHCHLVVQLVKSRDNNKKLRLKIESKPSKDLEFDDGKVCENRGQLFVLCNSNILYNYVYGASGIMQFVFLFQQIMHYLLVNYAQCCTTC